MEDKPKPKPPMLISVAELCRTLGIGKTKAYEIINLKLIQSRTIGRRRLVVLESVEAFARGNFAQDAKTNPDAAVQ